MLLLMGCITAGPSVSGVPPPPETPNRNFRCPQDLWEKMLRKAADRGETVTDLILRALRREVQDYD